MQRTIAIAVVGCAALALWAAPAYAADTPVSPPATDVAASPSAAPGPSDSPLAAASMVPDPAPAEVPDAPAQAAVPDAAQSAVQAAADTTSSVPASIDTAGPASNVVDSGRETIEQTVDPSQSGAAKVSATLHVQPADDAATQAFTRVSNSADPDVAAGSIAHFAGPSGDAGQSSATPSGHELVRDGRTPPPSAVSSGRASVAMDHLISFGLARLAAATGPLTISGPGDAGSRTAPVRASGEDSLPGLPGPRQIPVIGSAGGSTTSSTGFFFFGFAILLGLLVLGGQAMTKRLRSASACWRPLPFVALLERPG